MRHDDGENAKNIYRAAGERFIAKNFAELCRTLQNFAVSRRQRGECSIFALSLDDKRVSAALAEHCKASLHALVCTKLAA